MWTYVIGAAAAAVVGYLVVDENKKLRVGDTALVSFDVLVPKALPPGLGTLNLGTLVPAGAINKNVRLLVTKRIPAAGNGANDTAEASIQTPVGPILVSFRVGNVDIIERNGKQQKGGR